MDILPWVSTFRLCAIRLSFQLFGLRIMRERRKWTKKKYIHQEPDSSHRIWQIIMAAIGAYGPSTGFSFNHRGVYIVGQEDYMVVVEMKRICGNRDFLLVWLSINMGKLWALWRFGHAVTETPNWSENHGIVVARMERFIFHCMLFKYYKERVRLEYALVDVFFEMKDVSIQT